MTREGTVLAVLLTPTTKVISHRTRHHVLYAGEGYVFPRCKKYRPRTRTRRNAVKARDTYMKQAHPLREAEGGAINHWVG